MSTPIKKRKSSASAPKEKNRIALFGAGAVVLGAVAGAIWIGGKSMIPDSTPASTAEQSEEAPQPEQRQAAPSGPEQEKPLFSETMLSSNNDEPEEPEAELEDESDLDGPFQIDEVAYALSRLELDEDGKVVLNEQAQSVLEYAFLDSGRPVDEHQLEELKTLIEAGLEGEAGAQAVEVTEKFYRYSNAYRDISDTLAVRGDPESLKNDYEQISRLRETHLGPDLAEQIYGKEEDMARYTLDVMALHADPDLSADEREQRQQELMKQYPHMMASDEEKRAQDRARSTN